MKIKIKKISSEEESQREVKSIIQQIEEEINNEKKVLERVNYINWKENVLTKSTWEEAVNYGNQILALILIQKELTVAEEAIKDEEWEVINECVSRLNEILSLNDADLKIVLNWTFAGNNYEKKITEVLNRLTELEKEVDRQEDKQEQEGGYGLVGEEEKTTLIEEIEKLRKEKRVSEEQINDKLLIKLRSGGVNNYRELIKKRVYSQKKLVEWRNRFVEIIQQVELEKKLKKVVRKKPFDSAELRRIWEELNKLTYRDVYSKIGGGERPSEKTQLKKTTEKAAPKLTDFKREFGLSGGGKMAERVVKGKKEVASEEVAKGWFNASSELNLDANGSLVAWQNGWNYEEKNFKRRDLPYNQKRADLGIWIQDFEKVEITKEKEIRTDEIVKWWKHRKTTGLNSKKSAEAWDNGWNYDEIKNGLGTLIPEAKGKDIKESFNIPVNQEKTLAQKKEWAKMKLVKFSRFSDIGEEEENKLKPIYKKGINEAGKTEEVQELLKNYFKKIASDQIKCALNGFSPTLEESDLTTESQSNIKELTDESASSKVEDAKSVKRIRNSVLGDIDLVKQLFGLKKELREEFIKEINTRLKLTENNNWKINLEKIDDKEWNDYINNLSIRSRESDTYKKVSGDLLTKLKKEIKKVDNEGKFWDQDFSDEEWEKLEKSFLCEKVDYIIHADSEGEVADEEKIEIIKVESVIVAVKNLAISRWKKKIEEKINLAKEMNEREEKDGEEIKKLIEELEQITKWDKEKDGANQKEAWREKENEFYTQLESLKYELCLSIIQKVEDVSEIAGIEREIKNMKGGYLPAGKKVSDLYQVLSNQNALINLKNIINNGIIPTEIEEINEQLKQLNKWSVQATKAEKNAYQKLKEVVDKKELELMREKHLKVDGQENEWEYNLTEEQKKLVRNSENKSKLLTMVGAIKRNHRFRNEFYQATGIARSPENDQLIDSYQKLGLGEGGSIYNNGWTDPSKIREDGTISLDGGTDRYDVRETSKLQAETMRDLQAKINEAEGKINTTSKERVAWLKGLLSFNEEWVKSSENELIREARKKVLKRKEGNLTLVLRKLSEKETQSILDDIINEEEYNKDYTQLDSLVDGRIEVLDDKYINDWKKNKSFLKMIKEQMKERLKFRADFLEVIGAKDKEINDSFIYKYQDKGLNGQQAGQVCSDGWTDPEEINSAGYANLWYEDRAYPFFVLNITRQAAKERAEAEEKLHKVIYRPEAKDDLEKLKSHLSELKNLIPQNKPTEEQVLTSIQYAYQKNKEIVDSKRERLEEAISNFQRQTFINKINVSVQKINASIQGQEVEPIEDGSTSRSISEWKEWINNKNTDLKEIERQIKNELTVEICALLMERLEDLCRIKPRIEYHKLDISDIKSYLTAEDYELTELATKGSEIAKKIIDLRNKQERDAVKDATEALQNLINKEESEDLEVLHSDLNSLWDLIPVDLTEEKSLSGRQLTLVEVEVYKKNRNEADKKELNLLKKIVKEEGKSWEPPLKKNEWEEIEKTEDKDQFWIVRSQFTYEREIERVLRNSEVALKNEKTQKSQLLGLTCILNGFGEHHEDVWEGKAWHNKKEEVEEMIKKLKIKFAGHEFDEYIGKIVEENNPSVLNGLGKEWTEELRRKKISDGEMPEGKRKKDLLAAIGKRKSEIEKGELSQDKTEAEKLAEARGEAENLKRKIKFFQEQLTKRDIIFEESNWDNKVLEVIDKGANLQEVIKKTEEILGVPLNRLGSESPSLTNFSEIANLLTEFGVVVSEKDENGRNYYNPEKLKNELAELKRKEKDNDSLRGTIKNKEDKVSQLNDEVGRMKTEKSTLTNTKERLEKAKAGIEQQLQEKEKELKTMKDAISQQKDDIKDKEKKIEDLTGEKGRMQKQINDLELIIAENVNQENKKQQDELKRKQKIIELLQEEIISNGGGKSKWKELEAKIEI